MPAELPPRESMEFDVVVVGAGPAGLAAAIRLKQISPDISVVVVEKGSEVGAHILSGAVIDPSGLDALLPDWPHEEDAPIKTAVTDDRFYMLGPAGAMRLPNFMLPPLMSNHGNFIVSLGNVCRWLAGKAEAVGVEIYPGFAANEVLYGENDEVVGVATGDMGVGKDSQPKDSFTRGMELRAKYTLLGEGARGQLTKTLIARYGLDRGREPQKFGLGIKELWHVAPERHRPGLVQHTFGWPLGDRTGGGSFLYHFDRDFVSVGFVVHLNYANPYLSPFEEFQRFKTHPLVRDTFAGGKRIGYGARAIAEGGWQSVPNLVFPGGALIGDGAGFLNVPRIKGTHNAMRSGMLAAEHAAAALAAGRTNDTLSDYEAGWRASPIGDDLWPVRNAKPLWSKLGTVLGIGLGGLDMWANTLGIPLLGTLGHGKPDAACLKPVARCRQIAYPKPDGKLTFDRLSSVFLSNTNHEEIQPVHLVVMDLGLQKRSELGVFGGPSTRYCPAGVYEWITQGESEARYVINAQNCVHCKTCDIKDPNGNITWVAPEGGGGPNYQNM
jgi:electron-transferring-flavoprotein dehydrogenase